MKTNKEEIKMMEFIIMTLSFTCAILLAGVIGCVILMQPKVMKWYMNWAMKISEDCVDAMFDEKDEES